MSFFKLLAYATILALFPIAGLSQDYSGLITEDYLHEAFTFGPEDSLKYADCGEMTYPTCTYIWGPPTKRDAARAAAGLKPDGAKMMVIFAQTSGIADWSRVTNVYSDAVDVSGLGQVAVWSAIRSQLSLMDENGLVIHVYLEEIEGAEAKAVEVAAHVLAGL